MFFIQELHVIGHVKNIYIVCIEKFYFCLVDNIYYPEGVVVIWVYKPQYTPLGFNGLIHRNSIRIKLGANQPAIKWNIKVNLIQSNIAYISDHVSLSIQYSIYFLRINQRVYLLLGVTKYSYTYTWRPQKITHIYIYIIIYIYIYI